MGAAGKPMLQHDSDTESEATETNSQNTFPFISLVPSCEDHAEDDALVALQNIQQFDLSLVHQVEF